MKITRCLLNFLSGVILLLPMGCSDSNTDKPVSDVDTLVLDTSKSDVVKDTVIVKKITPSIFELSAQDKSILNILYSISPGYSFNKSKEVYNSLKGIRPEENKDNLASQGYTESVCKQNIFGGEALAEFNFKNDSLYSFIFTYSESNFERAEKIVEDIKAYYSAKLGEPQLDRVEEENKYNQTFVWPTEKYGTPFLIFNLNTNSISWGKRAEKPL